MALYGTVKPADSIDARLVDMPMTYGPQIDYDPTTLMTLTWPASCRSTPKSPEAKSQPHRERHRFLVPEYGSTRNDPLLIISPCKPPVIEGLLVRPLYQLA